MTRHTITGWITLAGTVLLSAFAVNMRVDNRIERWVHPPPEERARYAAFRDTFGSDEFILIAYTGQTLFDGDALDAQVATLEAVEAVPDVLRTDGIPAVYRDRFGQEDAEALAEEFTSTPFYTHFLINESATVAALLVEVNPPPSAEGRGALVDALDTAAQPLRDFGFEVHMAGPPLLNAVLDTASQTEAARTFPPALAVSLVVLLLLFRSWRAVAVAMVCATLTVTATLGAMGLGERSMTMITSALPALLWVLSLAASVHVINRYRAIRAEGLASADSLILALRDVTRPCLLAGTTTAAGFLALSFADLAPVREFGLFAALGVAIATVLALVVCPLCIRLFRVEGSSKTGTVTWWTSWVARFVARRRVPILLAGGGLTIACVALLPRIAIESDPLSFLPEDSQTVTSFAFIGENLTGFYSLEAVIDLGAPWAEPAQWQALETVVESAAAMPGVARVLSPLDMLRKLRQWDAGLDPVAYALPGSAEEARTLLDNLDGDAQVVLGRFVDDSGEVVRLSLLIHEMNSNIFEQIVAGAEEAIAAMPAPAAGHVTGIVRQLVESQLALVHTQVRSFAVALLAIVVCMGLGLRSVRMALLAIAPNVLPVLVALALMALFGVPLDAGTVMVASVALGIAVDDTAHILAGIQRARREGMASGEAVEVTMRKNGPALIVTTLTACAGFAALWRSQFVPIAWFGAFSTVALVVALAADLFLTPAIYLLAARKEE
jgi:predicted RND superfamily exporter protein